MVPGYHTIPKFLLHVKRILRQMPNLGTYTSDDIKGGSGRKFLSVNGTRVRGYESSMTGMSMVAPSSTLSTNSTLVSAPSDLQTRTLSAISRHYSLVAVLIIMSVFLVFTISTTGWMLAFCKKKNTVFALQKCEQDSEYELDDMDQTDTEVYDDSEVSPKMKRVRSRTCPSFSNVTDSDWSVESPSREPLVRHDSRNQFNHSGTVNMLPRSYTINVLQNVSSESLELENIDNFSTKADVNLLMEMASSVESVQTSIGALVE